MGDVLYLPTSRIIRHVVEQQEGPAQPISLFEPGPIMTIDMGAVTRIANSLGLAEAMAFVVLSRGASCEVVTHNFFRGRVSTWSARAVERYTGQDYVTAKSNVMRLLRDESIFRLRSDDRWPRYLLPFTSEFPVLINVPVAVMDVPPGKVSLLERARRTGDLFAFVRVLKSHVLPVEEEHDESRREA